eukprot:gene4825-6760_t
MQGALTRVTNQLNEARNELSDLEREETSCIEKESNAKEGVSKANAKVAELNSTKEAVVTAMKQYHSRRLEIQSDKESLSKKLAGEEILIERGRAQLHEIIQNAQVDKISLPTVDPNDSSTGFTNDLNSSNGDESSSLPTVDDELQWSGAQVEKKKKGSKSGTSRQSKQGMDSESSHDEDSSDQATSSNRDSAKQTQSTHFSQGDNPVVVSDFQRAARIDLSSMRRYTNLSKLKLDERQAELSKQIEDIIAELETIQPNMHALERYEGVTEKLRECSDELEQAKDVSKNITLRFEEVKKNRESLFQDCYNHISRSLGLIYRDLTRSSKHPLGGNAYLTLDNTEEPYLAGVRFTAMPPMKRFRDMDQLSGGEKTMAALALLFSIHSFRQAPFFVLDEVDAALDNVNVKKICNYIKQRSSEFQCIVISLKDMFFQHADCLVGICKDIDSQSSQVLTLDLRRYVNNADNEQNEGESVSVVPSQSLSNPGTVTSRKSNASKSPSHASSAVRNISGITPITTGLDRNDKGRKGDRGVRKRKSNEPEEKRSDLSSPSPTDPRDRRKDSHSSRKETGSGSHRRGSSIGTVETGGSGRTSHVKLSDAILEEDEEYDDNEDS